MTRRVCLAGKGYRYFSGTLNFGGSDLVALQKEIEALQRTQRMFKGVVARS